MDSRILVKFHTSKNCIYIDTISKDRKPLHDFTLHRDDFLTLERDGHMIACDLLSFAEFQRDKAKETVTIRFTWLDNNGYQLVGWAQSVELPYKELMDFTLGNRDKQRTWKILSIEHKNSPRFVFQCPNQLHQCLKDKIIRRKLIRFLRDNFRWWGAEKICFYSDFAPYSFTFREYRKSGLGMTGGLIYHCDQDLSTGYYAVHT